MQEYLMLRNKLISSIATLKESLQFDDLFYELFGDSVNVKVEDDYYTVANNWLQNYISSWYNDRKDTVFTTLLRKDNK